MAKIKPLRQSPVFKSLTDREIALFSRIVSEEEYSPGTLLTASNMKSENFYFIERGRITVSLGSADNHGDLVLGEGDTFGEWSLLTPGHLTSAWLKVSEPSNILRVDTVDFEKFAKEEPETALKVLRALAAVIRRSVEEIKGILSG
ncbi:MAG: Crp/Fnr family transcriptional regulator [bacterium]|nr:MAG: Crp/Fnr family transcriptional regulator [bacterium]